jgi:hypothetical protein
VLKARVPGVTAASSLAIVAVLVAVPKVALVGVPRLTVKVSLDSTLVSPLTRIVMVLLVSPGLKVRVPSLSV